MDDWLTLRARTHADRPAIAADGRTLTYAELDAAASVTARRLAAFAVGPGDRVVTTLPAGLEIVRLLHATARLGAALVPLNTRLVRGELASQEADAAARVRVDEPLDGDEADLALQTRIDPQAPWTVMFTSGTSGRARPVALTHRNHAASAFATAWGIGVAPDDRWLCPLPLFHVGGLAIVVRSAVWGTAAEIHERFEAGPVAAALDGGEVTLVSLVPTMLRRLAREGLGCPPALRALLLGGAGAPPDLLDWAAAAGLPLVRSYGMTETCSQVAIARGAEEGAEALPGVRLRIAADGQIVVAGPMVAGGGELETGDLGELGRDGRLRVLGRIDDLIVSGGENVSPAEVEAALLSHPGVDDAAVVGRPDREWGEVVTAFVVAGTKPDPDALLAHARTQLAAYKLPKAIHGVPELPRNAAGKLDRRALRARLSAH